MDTKKIKLVLGGHFSTPIIKHLEKSGFKPKRSEKFTTKIIRDLLSGKSKDIEVLQEISNFVLATEKSIKKIKTSLKQ